MGLHKKKTSLTERSVVYSYDDVEKTGMSRYFLSQDIAHQKHETVSPKYREEFLKTIVLPEFDTGLAGRKAKRRQTRVEALKCTVRIFVMRIIALLSKMGKEAKLTFSGRMALQQLEDLYSLVSLDSFDDTSLMRLKLAYGEACFHVSQASRGYYTKHRGGGEEEYLDCFSKFLEFDED
ncbi:MAG: hypothetical protein ABIH83_01490 [Candidatus Micrarchaeota archaeon]